MKHYLVTGGAGFIGSNIAQALVQRGDSVRILDNFSTGYRENLADFSDKIEIIEADITDSAAVAEAMEDVDCVFHQAALASVPRSVEKPLDTHEACVTGTLKILDQARRSGVRRVIYAASSSAYGDQPHSSKRESDLPSPRSPYAVAKLAGEYYCQAFYHTYGLETVCIRYFNVFGPRQDPNSPYSAVIPKFITSLLAGNSPTIYGDGEQSRDFTFIENVVHGNLLAAEAEGIGGRSFNVANGKSTSLNNLLNQLNKLLDTDVSATYVDPRVGDVKHSLADITLAQKWLDYEPPISFEGGLRRSIDYYRSLREVQTGSH